MRKHVVRIGTGIVALAGGMTGALNLDLSLADRNFAFFARTFGVQNPGQHVISDLISHPFPLLMGGAAVFAAGCLVSAAAEHIYRHARARASLNSRMRSMWPQIAFILSIALMVCAAVGFARQRLFGTPDDIALRTTGVKPLPILLGINAYLPRMDYDIGSDVAGIEWGVGYSHLVVEVKNSSTQSYDDLNMILAPETAIIEARAKSSLATCQIASTTEFGPIFSFGVDPEGKAITRLTAPVASMALGPPYRLYCPKLPAGARIRVDLATVVLSNDATGHLWLQERHDPAFLGINVSYNVGTDHHAGRTRIALNSKGPLETLERK